MPKKAFVLLYLLMLLVGSVAPAGGNADESRSVALTAGTAEQVSGLLVAAAVGAALASGAALMALAHVSERRKTAGQSASIDLPPSPGQKRPDGASSRTAL